MRLRITYQMDFQGDGIVDYTGAAFEDIIYTYTAEGIYYPTLRVMDSQGNAYSDTIAVTVLNKTKLDNLLKKKWEGVSSSLGIKDTSKALTYISSATRASYQQTFDALKDNLPAIIATKREFNLIAVMGNVAKYELITFENSKTYSYEVIFVREKDGFWVIQDF